MFLLIVTFASLLIALFYWMPRILFQSVVRLQLLYSGFRRRKYIKVDDKLTACYIERGHKQANKPTILYIHSFTTSCTNFCHLAPYIDGSYHLIGVDMLNHGGTSSMDGDVTMSHMMDFLEKFIDKIGLDKVHVMGFSTGGTVAASLASCYPLRVASLVVGGPAGYIVDKPEKEMSDHSIEELKGLIMKYSNNQLSAPDIFLHSWADYIRANSGRHAAVDRGILTDPHRFKFTPEFLKTIKADTLVMWGDEDVLCLTKGAHYMCEHLPNPTLNLIKNCGHMIIETHAIECCDAINKWIHSHDDEK